MDKTTEVHSPRHATPDPVEPSEDAFAKFAPAEPEHPSRVRRATHRIGKVLLHEWTLVALGSLLLAAVLTWPALRNPASTLPQDLGDPTLNAWSLAWAGHILTSNPAQLWDANAFHPELYSYAFTDTLLGYAPLSMIGEGFTAALVRYNIIYVLAHALAFFGAYVLVRQLGATKSGAAVAGAAFAFAPWRLAQGGHLHILSTGGIALALAMLARGHGYSLRHGFRPERRKPGWALAGWLVAAWQISIGFGIGLPFGYLLAAIVLVAGSLLLVQRFRGQARPFGGKLLAADLTGGTIFATVTLLLGSVYLTVAELHPYAQRSPAEVGLYSPPLLGFITAPAESLIWGDTHAAAREALPWHPEMTLLPGFILIGLAIAGLIRSIWTVRQRVLLGLGALLSIILAMGTQFFGDGNPGYMTLYGLLPGWDGIRTPGRLIVYTTLLLGILAAGAVSAFATQASENAQERVPNRPHPLLQLAMAIPLLLVLGEGLNSTPHPVVPQPPAVLAGQSGPLLVLPSDSLPDMQTMLWTTADGEFPKIVNGNSGFTPRVTDEVRKLTVNFPDTASIARLKELGIATVIVLKDRVVGTAYEGALTAPVDGLNLERIDYPDSVVFTLT